MVNHPRRSKTATTSRAAKAAVHHHELDYSELLAGVRRSFENAVRGQTRLFTTDATGLWEKYLSMLPGKAERQVHNCHCCRRFVQTYGGLVGISAEGETWPVMWRANGVPDFYKPAFIALHQIVDKARVTGVFLTKAATWGTPESSGKGYGELWQHLSVVPAPEFLHHDRALEPNQVAAAIGQNAITVRYAMTEYTPAVLDEALRVLASETLDRSEKFVGPVKWLRALHDWPKGEKNQTIRHNILLRAVALAPEGFCHIKSSVVGPLLDDIVAGVPFEDLKRKHAAKMHPLRYQRPQAAPSIGNVAAAEALVAKLGIAPSLERRFARFEELQDALWTWSEYRAAKPAAGGVFGHIKTKDGRSRGGEVPSVDLPRVTMTWQKFVQTIMGTAEEISCEIPSIGPFCALTTAAHSDAPPIMKWDRDDERNPFSWYTYFGGSHASQWKLLAGRPAKVNAIVAAPGMWGTRPMPELGDGVFLIIDGCADTRIGQGNAIFPEHLKSDLHGARSTIEAYSKTAELSGREEASACGWPVSRSSADVSLRVFAGNAWTSYHIDRWD